MTNNELNKCKSISEVWKFYGAERDAWLNIKLFVVAVVISIMWSLFI